MKFGELKKHQDIDGVRFGYQIDSKESGSPQVRIAVNEEDWYLIGTSAVIFMDFPEFKEFAKEVNEICDYIEKRGGSL